VVVTDKLLQLVTDATLSRPCRWTLRIDRELERVVLDVALSRRSTELAYDTPNGTSSTRSTNAVIER
jgi:hypothetical protein